MNFTWLQDLRELAREAREVGERAAMDRWFHEDSWIAQTDRAFGRELASRGWLGIAASSSSWGGSGAEGSAEQLLDDDDLRRAYFSVHEETAVEPVT